MSPVFVLVHLYAERPPGLAWGATGGLAYALAEFLRDSPDEFPEERRWWIAAGVSVLTLIGTVVTQVIGFRSTKADTERQIKAQSEQLDQTLNEQRTRTWNERFATAAGQLGSDKPPEVRLAGVYAMAGLADDWEANRQTCVDVLCAYLRLPYDPDPGENADLAKRIAYRSNREVRHTVIRVIAAHLQKEAAVSWQGLNFDFTGVIFDGGRFTGACFSGGIVLFAGAVFSSGTVDFGAAEFSRGTILFNSARFVGSRVNFNAKFSGGWISFTSARFGSGQVSFEAAKFSGSRVDFLGAEFSGSRVYFCHPNRQLQISDASFSGGIVNFGHPGDWSVPPEFPWTGTPPPSVKLPDTGEKAN